MAVSKILCIGSCGAGYAGKHLSQALEYISKKEKTGDGRWEGCLNCLPGNIYQQMRQTKEHFGKTDKRQGYHIILSFAEGEVDAAAVFEITGKFAREYLGSDYEALYTVHDNTDHIHAHIIFNSVSFRTGNKYHYKKGDWAKEIQPVTNRLCMEYGLSTIGIPETGRGSQEDGNKDREWDVSKNGEFIWADMVRRDLDAAVDKASSYEAFLSVLAGMGYGIKNAYPQEGKYLAVKPMGMAGYRRCKSLGEEYTRENIQKRIQQGCSRAAGDSPESYLQYEKGTIHQTDGCGIQHRKKEAHSVIQEYYFTRLCRVKVLKKRPYSQAWKYREDIMRMKELQEDYLFLCKYDIHTSGDLAAVAGKISEDKKSISSEKSSAYRERTKIKPLFDAAAEIKGLQACENCFQRGDMVFKEEHRRYMELLGQMEKEGYTDVQLENLQEEFKRRISIIQHKEKENTMELRIARRIMEELELREQEIEKKTEKQDLPYAQENKGQERNNQRGSR